jgi:GntR family transcriptional regulator of arabinose operon
MSFIAGIKYCYFERWVRQMSIPLYQKIYDDILEGLKSGKLAPGDKVMSEKELAHEYGVSRITSKKALEMLASDGYIKRMPGRGSFVQFAPGSSAKGSGRRWKIGVVMDSINDVFGSGILSTIEKLAEDNGFFVVLRIAYGRRDMEESAIQALLDFGVDGMILMTSHSEDINPLLLQLVIDKVPIVLVDRYLRGIPAPFVGTNNYASTAMATDYILELGHRHISFLTRPFKSTTTIQNRLDGFIKSHAEHGVAIEESKWVTDISSIVQGGCSPENIEADVEKICTMLRKNPDVTCLFAAEYNITSLAVKAVRRLGISVPEDISIICFDGPSDFTGESFFTRIVQPEEKIGRKAVQILIDELCGKTGHTNEKQFFMGDLVIGKSTCPPKEPSGK